MENPNTRPYTAEELEALLKEEASNSDMPENNKGSKTNHSPIIFQNMNLATPEEMIYEINASNSESTVNQKAASKLKAYAPFLILGVILTSVGIYLYYDYRKRKKAEKRYKPENE